MFGFACQKGTILFVSLGTKHAVTEKFAIGCCKKKLKPLEQYYAEDKQQQNCGRFTIAECVLYSLLRFAKDMYNVHLLAEPELPSLRRFYEVYGRRDSARVKDDHLFEYLKLSASQ
jgi:glutathione S-transferase